MINSESIIIDQILHDKFIDNRACFNYIKYIKKIHEDNNNTKLDMHFKLIYSLNEIDFKKYIDFLSEKINIYRNYTA